MFKSRRKVLAVGGVGSLLAVGLMASQPAEAIGGSTFEILDGNLVTNGAPDWATVNEIRKADADTGANDNSFGNGTKEDTAVPSVVDGSIPNNKSDLKNFGVYLETAPNGNKILNLFWTRVQEPNGTTNMDFEFNQSSTLSANGVTPVRTAGDVLIQYDLTSGGTHPELFLSRWVATGAGSQCEANNATPCWGTRVNLSAAGVADGSINTLPILAADSDGLGALSARTFGEAQVNFSALTGGLTGCFSFGSAYLKSRASDSFTAAVKDFIAPAAVNITNCGSVKIRKETIPEEDPNSTTFGYTSNIVTDPVDNTVQAFNLQDDGLKNIANVVQGSYTATETAPPAGWVFDHVDCSASSGVTVDASAAPVIAFTIDASTDVVDCTYYNRAQAELHVVKVAEGGGALAFPFSSSTLSPASWSLANGGQRDFLDLAPGGYDVAEGDTPGWNLDSATCDNGDDPAAITLAAGDDVTCTFVNVPETGAILIHKDRKHAADGPGNHPHANVDFTVDGQTVTTNANGNACVDGLGFGSYDVTESLPAGYHVEGGLLTKSVTVDNEASCGADPYVGETVNFVNIPLTDITVSVDSKVDGGTASTIDCVVGSASTGPNGDGSLTVPNLEPNTYTCTIVIDP